MQESPVSSHVLRTACLETIKILSRERGGLDAVVNDALLTLLVGQAHLKPLTEEDERGGDPESLAIAEGETKGES